MTFVLSKSWYSWLEDLSTFEVLVFLTWWPLYFWYSWQSAVTINFKRSSHLSCTECHTSQSSTQKAKVHGSLCQTRWSPWTLHFQSCSMLYFLSLLPCKYFIVRVLCIPLDVCALLVYAYACGPARHETLHNIAKIVQPCKKRILCAAWKHFHSLLNVTMIRV